MRVDAVRSVLVLCFAAERIKLRREPRRRIEDLRFVCFEFFGGGDDSESEFCVETEWWRFEAFVAESTLR